MTSYDFIWLHMTPYYFISQDPKCTLTVEQPDQQPISKVAISRGKNAKYLATGSSTAVSFSPHIFFFFHCHVPLFPVFFPFVCSSLCPCKYLTAWSVSAVGFFSCRKSFFLFSILFCHFSFFFLSLKYQCQIPHHLECIQFFCSLSLFSPPFPLWNTLALE